MKLLKSVSRLSLAKTLACWGISIAGYGVAYFGLSALGHSVSLQGMSIVPSLQGLADSMYYSALQAFSPSLSPSGSSLVVDALAKSQLVLSAGFFGLFVQKAAKTSSPFHSLTYHSVPEHINRMLSKLYIFRYDIGKLLEKIRRGTLTRHHMRDFWIAASGVDTAMVDLHELSINYFVKNIRERKFSPQDRMLLKRTIAAVDAAFWNLSCLVEECNKQHIKWNYPETVQSIGHNMMLAEDIIQEMARQPLDKEMLYQLSDVQKTFSRLVRQIREKEDIGFSDLADLHLEKSLEKELQIKA